jgi:hypothetical protein
MGCSPLACLIAAIIIVSAPVSHGQEPPEIPLNPGALPQIPIAPRQAESAQPAAPDRGLTVAEVIARVNRGEAALIAHMRAYRPLIEVYVQDLVVDEKLGSVPNRDEYFLGQFEWRDGPKMEALSSDKSTFKGSSFLKRPLGVQYLPDGFAALSVPDWSLLDPNRYEFTFARREFLGEARCLVFDVKPRHDRREGFSGRIWIDDRDFNIVRFNGINRSNDTSLSGFFRKKLSFHVDSWRLNAAPGEWLPAYVYCEETDIGDSGVPRAPRIKSQVRMWGYGSKETRKQQQFTEIVIDEPSVRDATNGAKQLSPVQSQRQWEREAEENVLDRLSKGGLLAPAGEVDRILDTVINNLIVTNSLVLDAPVHCRILLTSPLELFTVGHTIVLSRGLIDVLPDEASLAMMLGHELAHVVLGHPLIDTKFAFADRLMISDGELLQTLQFHHDPREESEADSTVIEMLKKSPYQDKMAGAGLFLRAIAAGARKLPNLIQPHIGEHIADGKEIARLGDLMQQAPALAPERLDQIAALPLGARLMVDPWTGRVELLRTENVPLVSAREKVPLAITPLMPFVKYAESPLPAAAFAK